mmetsp:Transcript_6619/g.24735  ORF Transcript_6619/g.24735 Transcript_6619/m.24735 type:complete len:574 (-) Transcript_6619:2159-3880(-)
MFSVGAKQTAVVVLKNVIKNVVKNIVSSRVAFAVVTTTVESAVVKLTAVQVVKLIEQIKVDSGGCVVVGRIIMELLNKHRGEWVNRLGDQIGKEIFQRWIFLQNTHFWMLLRIYESTREFLNTRKKPDEPDKPEEPDSPKICLHKNFVPAVKPSDLMFAIATYTEWNNSDGEDSKIQHNDSVLFPVTAIRTLLLDDTCGTVVESLLSSLVTLSETSEDPLTDIKNNTVPDFQSQAPNVNENVSESNHKDLTITHSGSITPACSVARNGFSPSKYVECRFTKIVRIGNTVVNNVARSSVDKRCTNWVRLWSTLIRPCFSFKCQIRSRSGSPMANCSKTGNIKGGHLKISDPRYHYIVPICSAHNASRKWDNPPNFMVTKPDTFGIAITPYRQRKLSLASILPVSTDSQSNVEENSSQYLKELGFSDRKDCEALIRNQTQSFAEKQMGDLFDQVKVNLMESYMPRYKSALERAQEEVEEFIEKECEPLSMANVTSWIPGYAEYQAVSILWGLQQRAEDHFENFMNEYLSSDTNFFFTQERILEEFEKVMKEFLVSDKVSSSSEEIVTEILKTLQS